jgi:type II secretory pathway component GspD/PulD (secretin)
MISPQLSTCTLLAVLLVANAAAAQEKPAPQKAARPAAAVLKTYSVPAGKAEILAGVLQEAFRQAPEVKIVAYSRDAILVLGPPETHLEVARHLVGVGDIITQVIPLATLPAERTVTTLKAMFGSSGLYLEADAARNAIIARGPREQIEALRAALGPLGESPSSGKVRVIAVEQGSAVALAEALQGMIRQLRPTSPVRVIVPGQKAEPAPKVPERGPKAKEPTKPHAPLTLTAAGNKLIAVSDDPEMLALVQELTRQLTQKQGEGDFEVIQLRWSNALSVAKVLDETFNGPAVMKGPRRVRIVADPATNALVVRASPLDLLTIKRLLRSALDSEGTDADVQVRTFILGPLKHATAGELVKVLSELYRGEGGRPGLVVTADPRTNSLLLRCSPALFQDIRRLVMELDGKMPEK